MRLIREATNGPKFGIAPRATKKAVDSKMELRRDRAPSDSVVFHAVIWLLVCVLLLFAETRNNLADASLQPFFLFRVGKTKLKFECILNIRTQFDSYSDALFF